MDAETAATLGDVDDAGDEVGHLLDEGGEFVDDDHERRRRDRRVAFEQFGEILGASFEQGHASLEFGAQRHQRPARQVGRQVGDGADGVRQPLEHVRRRAALVVDEQEVEPLRRMARRERDDHRLQQLALAGSRCAADQGVWTVGDQVESDGTLGADTDRERQRGGRRRTRPRGRDRLGGRCADDIEERDGARDRRGERRRRGVAHRRQRACRSFGDSGPDVIEFEITIGHVGIGRPQATDEARAVGVGHGEDAAGLSRHLGGTIGQPHHADAHVERMVEQAGDRGRVGSECGVEHDDDPGPCRRAAVRRVLHALLDDGDQTGDQIVGAGGVGGEVRSGHRGGDGAQVRQPLGPTELPRRCGGQCDDDVVRAVQGSRVQDDRRRDTIDEDRIAVYRQVSFGERVADRHRRQPFGAADSTLRLDAQVGVATGLERHLERCSVVAESEPEVHGVGRITASFPQVDRAVRRATCEVGDVG